jgi:CTP:molybdopterin cytidylyltransferase MocA
MGRNKLLLQLGDRSVLRRAVDTALAAGLNPVLVVVGHQRDQAEAELRDARCALVVNPDYQAGVNTSLRTGIRAVPDGCPAAVVMLADMPLVTERYSDVLESHRGDVRHGGLQLRGVDAPPSSMTPACSTSSGPGGEGCGRRW